MPTKAALLKRTRAQRIPFRPGDRYSNRARIHSRRPLVILILRLQNSGGPYISGLFSVSPTGVLAYSAGPGALWLSQLSWFDRQGKKLGNAGQPGTYSYSDFALSPDGARLAATKTDPRVAEGEMGIWLLDLLRGVSTRLTFDLAPDSAPVWSPDGSRVAFTAVRAGGYGIIRRLPMA